MALDSTTYTLTNALLLGNCQAHYRESQQVGTLGGRAVHLLLAAIELLPLIGQIVSLVEYVLMTRASTLPPSPKQTFPTLAHQFETLVQQHPQRRLIYWEDGIEVTYEQHVDEWTMSPWQLHLSASADDAAAVLAVAMPVLLRYGAIFKVVETECLVEDYNRLADARRGRYKEGQFITVYAPTDRDVRALAQELDFALTQSLPAQHTVVDHTGRPLGNTGRLWARHFQAGHLTNLQEYRDLGPALATEGNYCITSYIPHTEEILHEDIFAAQWGKVDWNASQGCFVPTA